jgi:hypothetical protein
VTVRTGNGHRREADSVGERHPECDREDEWTDCRDSATDDSRDDGESDEHRESRHDASERTDQPLHRHRR